MSEATKEKKVTFADLQAKATEDLVADLKAAREELFRLRFQLALKQLDLKWEAATETWNDAASKAFHKEHIEPLMPDVKQTLEAVGRLAEVLARAARDVSDTTD